MPAEVAREIARQGEVRLSALMDLATAADLRATTLCGICGAGSVGIMAAVLAVLSSDHQSWPLIAGGVVSSFCLFISAIIAAMSGAPRDFYLGGGNPDTLRNWSWTGAGWRNETEMLDATGDRYARSIAANAAILRSNTWRIQASLWIAGVSPIFGLLAFFICRFMPLARHPF